MIQKSDWLADLFESGQVQELDKPARHLNTMKWDSLIKHFTGGAMSFSVLNDDPSLTGSQAFSLSRQNCPPMLGYFFTDNVLAKYGTVFRHMFHAKYTEHKLKILWKRFQSLRQIDTDERMFSCYLLLHGMLHFIHNYLLFLSLDVIGSKDWDFKTSRDVSLEAIKISLEETMAEIIRDLPTPRSVDKILSTCNLFASQMTRFLSLSFDMTGSLEDRADSLSVATSQERYLEMVNKFSEAFKVQIGNLLIEIRSKAPALLSKLDFNGFYRDRLGIDK
jgi:hypothetical protein